MMLFDMVELIKEKFDSLKKRKKLVSLLQQVQSAQTPLKRNLTLNYQQRLLSLRRTLQTRAGRLSLQRAGEEGRGTKEEANWM